MTMSGPGLSATASGQVALPAAVARVFGDAPFRLDGELLALAFASNGAAWSIEEPGVLRQWDVEAVQTFQKRLLSDLELIWTFSPNAALVASGSDDIAIWSVASGQLLGCLVHGLDQSWVTAQAFRGDNRMLATGHDDGRVRLWDLSRSRLVCELELQDRPISALAFSPQGVHLAVAAEDKSISLWHVESGRLIGRLIGHTDRVQALAWHPSSETLVSAGWDATARVWNARTLEPVILLNAHAEAVTALAFSPDGRLLACSDHNQVIWIWDAYTHRPLHILGDVGGHGEEITALAFHPDGKRLLSGGRGQRLTLWDVSAGRSLVDAKEPPFSVARLSAHPGGRYLACASGGPAMRIWDALEGKSLFQIEQANVQAVAFAPKGDWLAAGDALGKVCLWHGWGEPLNGQMSSKPRTLQTHGGGITSLAFDDAGTLLAAGDGVNGCVYLWSMESFEPILLIPEATDRGTVESVRFVANSNLIAVAGLDWLPAAQSAAGNEGLVCVWDIVQRRKVLAFPCEATRLAVHPDGRHLACNDAEGSIHVWDLYAVQPAFEMVEHGASVSSLAYDPRGRYLASGGEDGVLRLWHAATLTPAGLVELDTPIKDLAFTPDGTHLFSANGNLTCYLLDLSALVAGG